MGSAVSLTSSTSANPTILGASSAGDLAVSGILDVLQCLEELNLEEEVGKEQEEEEGRMLDSRWMKHLLRLIDKRIIVLILALILALILRSRTQYSLFDG